VHTRNNCTHRCNNNYIIILYNITRIEHSGPGDGIPYGIAAVSLWEFSRRRRPNYNRTLYTINNNNNNHHNARGPTEWRHVRRRRRRSRNPRTPRDRPPPFPSRLRPGASRVLLSSCSPSRRPAGIYYNNMYIIMLYRHVR